MRRLLWVIWLVVCLLASCRITSEEPLTAIVPEGEEMPADDPVEPEAPDLEDPEDLEAALDRYEMEDPEWEDPAPSDPVEPDPVENEPDIERITWIGSIRTIFRNRCVRCHSWASSYTSVVYRIETGTMEYYIDIGHYISGSERQQVLDWIEGGYPEQ